MLIIRDKPRARMTHVTSRCRVIRPERDYSGAARKELRLPSSVNRVTAQRTLSSDLEYRGTVRQRASCEAPAIEMEAE